MVHNATLILAHHPAEYCPCQSTGCIDRSRKVGTHENQRPLNHPLTVATSTGTDLLLPDGEVVVGDSWPVEDAALHEILGMGPRPVLFEQDDDEQLFGESLKEGGTITGTVEFEEIEEREGVRCAALTFTIEFQTEINGMEVFGIQPDEVIEDTSCVLEAEIRSGARSGTP